MQPNNVLQNSPVQTPTPETVTPNASPEIPSERVPEHLIAYISESYWQTLSTDQKKLLGEVKFVPPQLRGVVPDTVWNTLSMEQKLQYLFSFDLIPHFEIPTAPEQMPTTEATPAVQSVPESVPSSEAQQFQGEVLVNAKSDVEQQFATAVAEVQKIEETHQESLDKTQSEAPLQVVKLDAADQARVDTEQGKSFSQPIPKMTGYSITDDIADNTETYMSGSVTNAKTWAAALLHKIRVALSSE